MSTAELVSETRPPGPASRAWNLLVGMCQRPSGAVGLTVVTLHLVLALAAPLIVPYDPATQDPAAMLLAPGAGHWLGTDQLGRDVLTRTLLGGREALLVTTVAAALAVAWGGLLGILAGLVGGWLDELLMRVNDAFLAVPWLLCVLVIASVVGTGGAILVPTLAFFYGISVVRIARGATLDVVARDFVTAARARGESVASIMLREILPNVRDVLLVEGAMEWSWMLLAFSSLSFLGFGVRPPTPDWGLMIADARLFLAVSPWSAIAPIVALSSLIIGINMATDALAKTLGIDRAQRSPV